MRAFPVIGPVLSLGAPTFSPWGRNTRSINPLTTLPEARFRKNFATSPNPWRECFGRKGYSNEFAFVESVSPVRLQNRFAREPLNVTAHTPRKIVDNGKVTAIHLDEIGRRQRRTTEAYLKYAAGSDEADDCQDRQMGEQLPLNKIPQSAIEAIRDSREEADVNSMTGFGRGQARGPHFEVVVEMKSTNHRFRDLRLRMPPPFPPGRGGDSKED